jgi:uncharacterized protein (DUF697 family)
VASKLPLDVRALYAAGKRLKQERDKPVRIAVLVEIDAPDELVEAAKSALHPKTSAGIVDVSVVEPGVVLRVDSRADAVIVLAGSGEHIGDTLADLRERAIPTAVVAVRESKGGLAMTLRHPDDDTITGLDPAELICGPLADWLMTRLVPLRTAIAHNFEFVRRAVAKEAVKATAWQNAVIGVVIFIPGADMPLMTMNQAKMLLQVAAAYGQPLDAQRVKELAAVVGGGFLLRTFAREALDFIPVLGWAVKGGVAYGGTMAMGMAAIEYFERGADLSGVVRAFSERAGEAAAWTAAHAPHMPETVHAGRERGSSDYTPALPSDTGALLDMGPGDMPEPEPRPKSAVAPATRAPVPVSGDQPTLMDVPIPEPTLTATEDRPGHGEAGAHS